MTTPPTSPSYRLTILAGWLLAVAILLATSADAIRFMRYPDADDAMRMVQVRDWLAGQGWFDVAQHRLNRGDFPMHWSRLVDLPLAAGILLLRPLLGAALAEQLTAVAVPLLTLLAIMALLAAIVRRVAGAATVPYAVLLVALSSPLLAQVRPLRIDHHGWQIVLALAAVRALVARPTWRSGAAIGVALALLLTVSLEGMPIAAAIAGVAMLRWALAPVSRGFALALGWSLAGAAVLLHLATRGPGFWTPACDAIAPVWLAALVTAAGGVTLAIVVARFGVVARLGALALAGAGAAALLAWLAPVCLMGPFATLPPLVYRFWYLMVLEGRPLWEQSPWWAATTIGLPLAGIAGTLLALRDATAGRRSSWLLLLAVQAAALGVAIMVNRAGATANALAVPGAAVLLHRLLARARAIPTTLPRIAATLGALLLASPGQVAAMALLAVPTVDPVVEQGMEHRRHPCRWSTDMAVLSALPRGTVFAPIDVTPALLVATPHAAVAGGYHRGAAAMNRVMTAFMAPPDRARAIVLASGADYLAACPGMNEMQLYRVAAPQGLWSRLERGERVAWLAPIPLPGPVLAWRVIRPADAAPLREAPARR
ncbi:hypothetical protein [Sphingomonas adhaesiva]|uniref:hypothetical protein n=1 Tax=Sphingomonas adhaesiva TaxID=28212 RepID=UPI002FF9AC50